MHNEKGEDFISMAEEDKLVMEESRHFGLGLVQASAR